MSLVVIKQELYVIASRNSVRNLLCYTLPASFTTVLMSEHVQTAKPLFWKAYCCHQNTNTFTITVTVQRGKLACCLPEEKSCWWGWTCFAVAWRSPSCRRLVDPWKPVHAFPVELNNSAFTSLITQTNTNRAVSIEKPKTKQNKTSY